MGQRHVKLEDLSYEECLSYKPKYGTFGSMVWKMIQRIHYPAEPDILEELTSLSKQQLCRIVSISKSSEVNPNQAEQMYKAFIDTEDIPVSCILMAQPWTQSLLDKLSEDKLEDMRKRIDPYSTDKLIETIHKIQRIYTPKIENYSGARISKSKRVYSPTKNR